MTGIYYKVLGEDGQCYYAGKGKWSLAQDGQPGEWMPRIEGELILCERGYHILRAEHLVTWLGPCIHRVEAEDPILWDDDKGVTARARDLGRISAWNVRTARLFAADCAEHVEHLYTLDTPWQPAQTIEVARRYAEGLATQDELAAAGAAAWAAAGDAAWAAAGDAARAAAWAAAGDAARAAAWAAAGDTAWAAAGAAEARWQTERLLWYLEAPSE